jgi:spoIIIJ-associated protein
MKREVVVTAKTIEQAVELGAEKLNMDKDDVTYEVLDLPKKGFLGLGGTDARVKVFGSTSPGAAAAGFIEKIIGHMKINAMPKIIEETDGEIKIDIIGDNLGTLIGYHGEILDSLQYLTYLVVNKDEDPGSLSGSKSNTVKISLDIENYRKKREETLKQLAKKMADRVLKYNRPVTLEPMNAYERRIIHSAIQDIPGVSTHSVGQESDRRIVVSKEGSGAPKPFTPRRPGDRDNPRAYNNRDRDKNYKK